MAKKMTKKPVASKVTKGLEAPKVFTHIYTKDEMANVAASTPNKKKANKNV